MKIFKKILNLLMLLISPVVFCFACSKKSEEKKANLMQSKASSFQKTENDISTPMASKVEFDASILDELSKLELDAEESKSLSEIKIDTSNKKNLKRSLELIYLGLQKIPSGTVRTKLASHYSVSVIAIFTEKDPRIAKLAHEAISVSAADDLFDNSDVLALWKELDGKSIYQILQLAADRYGEISEEQIRDEYMGGPVYPAYFFKSLPNINPLMFNPVHPSEL